MLIHSNKSLFYIFSTFTLMLCVEISVYIHIFTHFLNWLIHTTQHLCVLQN